MYGTAQLQPDARCPSLRHLTARLMAVARLLALPRELRDAWTAHRLRARHEACFEGVREQSLRPWQSADIYGGEPDSDKEVVMPLRHIMRPEDDFYSFQRYLRETRGWDTAVIMFHEVDRRNLPFLLASSAALRALHRRE